MHFEKKKMKERGRKKKREREKGREKKQSASKMERDEVQ